MIPFASIDKKVFAKSMANAVCRMKWTDASKSALLERYEMATVSHYYVIVIGNEDAVYVGKSINPEIRFQQHVNGLCGGRYYRKFQRLFNKYGPNLTMYRFPLQCQYQEPLQSIFESSIIGYYRELGYKVANFHDPLQYVSGRTQFTKPLEREELREHKRLAMGTVDARRNVSNATKIAMQRPEVKERLREGLRRYYSHEENLEANRERQRIAQNRPDVNAKRRTSMQKYWQNPEYLSKNRKILKHAMSKPEVRERLSKAQKKSYANNTELKRRISNSIKRYYSDPKNREKVSIATKKAMNKPEMKEKMNKVHMFRRTYGWAKRFEICTGKFEPWMHFGIKGGLVTVWAWDTRKIQFTCKESELPANNYIKAKDSYEPLINNIC